MIRAFFAFKLPQKVLEQIEQGLSELKRSAPNHIKWVAFDSMHITLKFIRSFNLKHLPMIEKDLETLLSGFGNINISTGKPGVFPDTRNPKTVWLGLKETDRLHDLVKIIDQSIMEYGYEKEKRTFSPHLTIGRVRNYVGLEEKLIIGQKVLAYVISSIGPIIIDRTSLIKSDLTQQGAKYTTLFEIKL
jgi:2'-5' RNA ligase